MRRGEPVTTLLHHPQRRFSILWSLTKHHLEGWEFLAPNGEWLKGVAPGSIHMDLQRQGFIEDPFVRDHESACQWVDERDWSYRRILDWQPEPKVAELWLVFEGLDTVCSVWVNGEKVAESDNMFLPVEVNLTDRLRPGSNEIRVDFQSAARVGRERKARYLAEQSLAEDVPNFDERAFVRKAQYMFGWDWGPRLVSCGIWRPVWMIEFSPGESSERFFSQTPKKPEQPRIKLLQKPDADGASFEFVVDGRPFYALGANWIPDHSFPSRETRERLEQRILQAKALGVNMLRIWGGGIYESDDFYDLCEKHGIFVWQDFMFACSYYPDTGEWQQAIRKEAEYQVARLRHHPCIALWCGNNECHQVWQDGWGGKDKQPSRFHGEAIYHEVLADVVARLDPDRFYLPGSPYGEGYCNSGVSGDQHYWDVWHGRGDWVHYRDSDARFSSEFGFMSSPSAATWKQAGVDSSLPVKDPVARAHNKTGKPFDIIQGLVHLHYPAAENLDEWSYASQLNQRDAMRAALEHYRFNGRCRGALIWQLNDCWPVESWSILEFEGRKKAVAHALPRLFAPLLLRIVEEEGTVRLEGCLHNATEPVEGEAALRCLDLRTGEERLAFRASGRLAPEEISTLVAEDCLPQRQCVWVGQFAGATVWYVPEKPFRVDRSPDLFWERTPSGARVTSRQVAVDIYAEDPSNPAISFEPNFFSLLPGESVELTSSGDFESLRFRCLDF